MKDSTILENSAKPKGAPMTPALESDCPTAMIRALGEFLAPGLPFKVRAPRIVRAIRAIEKRLADDRRAYRARSGGTAGAPDRAGIGHGGGRL